MTARTFGTHKLEVSEVSGKPSAVLSFGGRVDETKAIDNAFDAFMAAAENVWSIKREPSRRK
jgi:hypothetical protein